MCTAESWRLVCVAGPHFPSAPSSAFWCRYSACSRALLQSLNSCLDSQAANLPSLFRLPTPLHLAVNVPSPVAITVTFPSTTLQAPQHTNPRTRLRLTNVKRTNLSRSLILRRRLLLSARGQPKDRTKENPCMTSDRAEKRGITVVGHGASRP